MTIALGECSREVRLETLCPPGLGSWWTKGAI